MNTRVIGVGHYLPENVVTNEDIASRIDTTDEWIRTRTGVERRHVVADDQLTSDMCVEAAKNAMDDAGVHHLTDEEVAALVTQLGFDYYTNLSLMAHK